QSMFHYTMFQEIVTKVTSKSANAINEVMKAQ
ncbi:EscI/YscI/HrpB family type III secretion system inner rod protein, partial [Vibrio parahaemolyticus]